MAMAKISTRALIEHVGKDVWIGEYTGARAELRGGIRRSDMEIVFWVEKNNAKKFLRVGDEIDVVVNCSVGKEGGGKEKVRQYRTFEFMGWTDRRR
jgi:hypothetical protein